MAQTCFEPACAKYNSRLANTADHRAECFNSSATWIIEGEPAFRWNVLRNDELVVFCAPIIPGGPNPADDEDLLEAQWIFRNQAPAPRQTLNGHAWL